MNEIQEFPSYRVLEKIHTGSHSIVYSARDNHERPIFIKQFYAEFPTAEQLARFRREYRITAELQTDGAIKTLDWVNDEQNPAIVLEDFGGRSLSELYANQITTVKDFLDIAIAAATALAEVHHKNIIHKDINPSNLIYLARTQTIKIIDFGISCELLTENQQQLAPENLEGTLLYISPEQTGRMNRLVDRRSDIYSLGATFYHLLAGRPPFISDDPAALVHAHLAQQPELVHELRSPQIPAMISQIVIKLLAKNAEDRYQSAAGLTYDLRRCRDEINENGRISLFEPALKDLPERFHVPHKFYGRENEIKELLSAFERTNAGACELLFVTGEGGVGKSSLIQEIRRPLARGKGRFISGKFDQFRRDLPYIAPAAAFAEFFRSIFAESSENVLYWKEKLTKKLGKNSGVIADIAPGLANILDEVPETPEVSSSEALARFHHFFLEFMQAIAGPEHPLVIFLDDLQWADFASLGLLELLLNDSRNGHLLLICAYRENEIHAGHPLTEILKRLEKQREIVHTIHLGSLAQSDVRELLADALYTKPEKLEQASLVLTDRTRGNPFFLRQLLETLAAEGNIVRDPDTGCFHLDMAALERIEVTSNVAEFMSKNILKLPQDEQEVLKTASCLGDTFHAAALDGILVEDNDKIHSALGGLVRHGLLLPMNEKFLYMDDDKSKTLAAKASFRFLHDRVRQAANMLLGDEHRSRLRFLAGRMLLDSLEDERDIIDVVNHLNAGRAEMRTESDFIELAALNLSAGRRSMMSGAFKSALAYLRVGRELLPEDSKHAHYRMYRELEIAMSRTLYQLGLYEELEKITIEAVRCMQNDLDKIKLYEIRILAAMAQSDHWQALREARLALALCGLTLPEKPGGILFFWEVMRTRFALRGKSNADLTKLPVIKNSLQEAALYLLTAASIPAFVVGINMVVWISLKGVQISVRYGVSADSAYCFSMYSLLLCNNFQKIEEGFEYGRLGLQLSERFTAIPPRIQTIGFSNGLVFHWKEALKVTARRMLENYQAGAEAGERNYTAYRILGAYYQFYLSGRNLQELNDEFIEHFESLARLKQAHMDLFANSCRQFVLNLCDPHEDNYNLTGSLFNSDDVLTFYHEHNDVSGLFVVYFWKLFLAVVFRDITKARDIAIKGDPFIEGGASTAATPPFYMLQALAVMNDINTTTGKVQKKSLRLVRRNLKKLTYWAKHCPENVLHRRLLVEAELLRVQKKRQPAREKYDLAISCAYDNGYVNDAALACELFAEFHQEQNNNLAARMYIRQARYFYQLWGARNKMTDLEKRYPRWLGAPSVEKNAAINVTTTSQGETASLDLSAILQASRALSGEIELERLLKQLVQLVLENAGARRCFLILAEKDGLHITAYGAVDEETRMMHTPVDTLADEAEDALICADAVRLTARTKVPLLLDAACELGELSDNEYLLREKIYSLSCFPLLRLGALTGVLYLENRPLRGAFTAERREVLDIIAGQAAVSIENARLYEEQRRSAKSFARFVPTEFLQMLGRNEVQEVQLGDNALKEMTVLFSDIRSFTTLSEGMTPEENFRFINTYLQQMGPNIREHGGFIDKYIGDAIMALFDSEPDRALDAAIDMLGILKDYNRARTERGRQSIAVGLGLNTGQLMLGTVGEEHRMDGTVIGDAVNLAARIEGMTKQYKASILISESVRNNLLRPHDYLLRTADRVRVKGKLQPTTIFEVCVESDGLREKKEQTLSDYEEGIRLYMESRFKAARAYFVKVADVLPSDQLANLYRERCERLEKQKLPDDWDGVTGLEEK